jgi:hypothetical protein
VIRKRDTVERGLVEFARAMGASWLGIDARRAGEPDGLVGYRGRNVLVEIKSGRAKPRAEQEAWHLAWRGARVEVWRTREDVAATLERLRGTLRA